MICPFLDTGPESVEWGQCQGSNCALWCNEDGCAFKKIAMELVKLGEMGEK